MVNYMKIRVNIEHEWLCERFKHEWPYNYPLILVAVCGVFQPAVGALGKVARNLKF